MNIKFISTLTPEDENAMAPAVLKAVASILDLLPIAYMIRIDTSDAHVYSQHSLPNGKLVSAAPETLATLMPTVSFDS